MVGFYGGAPLEYAGINELGSDAVPSGPGEVLGASFGEGLAQNITPRAFRSAGRFAAETGVLAVDEYGRPIMGEPEPTIDPETANAEYGIKGHLSFDKPVPRSVAEDLRSHKQAQIERQDAIDRRESSLLTGGAARFSASLMAGVLDPINLAVGFIPVLGEARSASLIAQAGSAAGRFGIRAAEGGAQGAAGMAALQPLEFGLSRQEHEDYTMAEALRSVALGTVLGGGLHAGIGALVDRASGRYRDPLRQRLEDAGPEARETLLQGALAQSIEGRPVDVAPALDVLEAVRRPAEAGELATKETARAPAEPRFTFEQEPGLYGGTPSSKSGTYSVKDAAGNEAAFLHVTFEKDGKTVSINNITAMGEGQPGTIIGPANMRTMARDFLAANPEVERIYGERVSGARSTPADVSVTREAIATTLDAARRQPEADPRATQEAADIQARAPEPPPEIADQIAEAQRHVDALMNELQPESAREPLPGEPPKTNPAPENKGADIPEMRQAEERMAQAEGDARAYEAAANCIAEKGL